jgi:hypothetical protein
MLIWLVYVLKLIFIVILGGPQLDLIEVKLKMLQNLLGIQIKQNATLSILAELIQ